VYLYFPTVTWKVWESHPFSAVGGLLPLMPLASSLDPRQQMEEKAASTTTGRHVDTEKSAALDMMSATTEPVKSLEAKTSQSSCNVMGLSFFIRIHTGLIRLVEAMHDDLNQPALTGLKVQVAKGERLDLPSILEKEVSMYRAGGVAVVVSGPRSMADDVRRLVAQLARREKGVAVGFREESYGW
jgi:hypothetical protein